MPDTPAPAPPPSPLPSPGRRLLAFGGWLLHTKLWLALLGGAALWIAQPPLMLGPLAWIAPAPWVLLVLRADFGGRGDWLKMWLAGAAYWAAALWWICLPHPATKFGLPFLAGYLGLYLPLFLALSRVGVHRLKAPVWIVAPVVWTALEWVQAHLFSGFLMGALSHTQAWSPDVIQIAAWVGAYGVSFVMMMFAAGLVDGLTKWRRSIDPHVHALDSRPPAGFFAAALPLAVTIFVGHSATSAADARHADNPGPTIALIQGDARPTWDPNEIGDRLQTAIRRQAEMSKEAADDAQATGRTIDLMVWPESMYVSGIVTFDGSFAIPTDVNPESRVGFERRRLDLNGLAATTRTPMLLGTARFDLLGPFDIEGYPPRNDYNSAVLIDAQGTPVAAYDKMHRVPFGEYIPLFEDWGVMSFLIDTPQAVSPGAAPVGMTLRVGSWKLEESGNNDLPPDAAQSPTSNLQRTISPNICYETVIPHVIRGHVKALTDAGTPPDLLVNVTNNAWFRGSSELEMHLACNLFRAVENRTPMVVAANGGLSASIDSAGRVLAVSDRQTEQVLVVSPPLDPETSFYTRNGDLLAWGCLLATALLAIIGGFGAWNGERGMPNPTA